MVGTTLGHYEILEPLGAGGMGEVYRARDTKLDRDVALKLLPQDLAADPDRLARLEREAKLLAALSHPHIATIHNLEEVDGLRFLVLELVEGESLARQVAGGPLEIDAALQICKQVAEALEAAHSQGIIHRDLKPANVLVTRDGHAKVLDFGIAKGMQVGDGVAETARDTDLTVGGTLVGTPSYMSPEQVRGGPIDKRSDVWALGCLVYEALTGRSAFGRETLADTLAAIVEQAPNWDLLPPLHPRARSMLERCLEKKARVRYHDIADARVDLEVALADPLGSSARPATREDPGFRPLSPVAVVAVVIITALVAGVAGWYLKPATPTPEARLAHVLPENQEFAYGLLPLVAASPDGSSIVYAARDVLFLRRLDRLEATPIRGTEGIPVGPFFSPDGRSVGYWDFGNAQLKAIEVSGGTPRVLDDAPTFRGASWGADGTIVYGKDEGIWAVSVETGEPELVVPIEEGWANGPQMLPDGRSLLYTLLRGGFVGRTDWESAEIVVQDLESGARKALLQGEDGRYIPTGHVVYADGSTLFAVPFDAARLEVSGGPVPVVEGVRREGRSPGGTTATANYDFTRDGMLVYARDERSAEPSSRLRDLVLVDREGVPRPLTDERRNYWRPAIDPDGGRVAVEVADDAARHIWVVDISAGVSTQLTFEGVENDFPVWTPDGDFVIFYSNRIEGGGIYRKPADGSGPAELLASPGTGPVPTDVSGDGTLVFSLGGQTERAIWTLPLEGGSATELLATPALEHQAMFSPNGAWIAYASGPNNRQQNVFIRPFPLVEGTQRQVSEGQGTGPVWSPDGSELYYVGADSIMVAPISAGFVPGRPRPLFPREQYRFSGNSSAFDIHPDGEAFIMVTLGDEPEPAPQQIIVVLNWFEELKERAPTRQ